MQPAIPTSLAVASDVGASHGDHGARQEHAEHDGEVDRVGNVSIGPGHATSCRARRGSALGSIKNVEGAHLGIVKTLVRELYSRRSLGDSQPRQTRMQRRDEADEEGDQEGSAGAQRVSSGGGA